VPVDESDLLRPVEVARVVRVGRRIDADARIPEAGHHRIIGERQHAEVEQRRRGVSIHLPRLREVDLDVSRKGRDVLDEAVVVVHAREAAEFGLGREEEIRRVDQEPA